MYAKNPLLHSITVFMRNRGLNIKITNEIEPARTNRLFSSSVSQILEAIFWYCLYFRMTRQSDCMECLYCKFKTYFTLKIYSLSNYQLNLFIFHHWFTWVLFSQTNPPKNSPTCLTVTLPQEWRIALHPFYQMKEQWTSLFPLPLRPPCSSIKPSRVIATIATLTPTHTHFKNFKSPLDPRRLLVLLGSVNDKFDIKWETPAKCLHRQCTEYRRKLQK